MFLCLVRFVSVCVLVCVVCGWSSLVHVTFLSHPLPVVGGGGSAWCQALVCSSFVQWHIPCGALAPLCLSLVV